MGNQRDFMKKDWEDWESKPVNEPHHMKCRKCGCVWDLLRDKDGKLLPGVLQCPNGCEGRPIRWPVIT